jgi:hypothetical protein
MLIYTVDQSELAKAALRYDVLAPSSVFELNLQLLQHQPHEGPTRACNHENITRKEEEEKTITSINICCGCLSHDRVPASTARVVAVVFNADGVRERSADETFA